MDTSDDGATQSRADNASNTALKRKLSASNVAVDMTALKKTKAAELVRSKVQRVLEPTGLADERAGKLDENAFLRLLYAFNKEHIHFA